MAEFVPITTQEEFDAAIASRLTREREKALRPYADYEQIKNDLETANSTLAARDATITDLTGQLQSARSDLAKTRIALEKGLPAALAERLTGETDDELRRDADSLLTLIGGRKTREPSRSTEKEKTGGKTGCFNTDDLRQVLNDMNLGG